MVRKFKSFLGNKAIFGVYSSKSGRLLSNHTTLTNAKENAMSRANKSKSKYFIKTSTNLFEI